MNFPRAVRHLFLTLGCAVPALAFAAAPAPRPNIIVLLCDDLGYGDLSCFAHPEIRTPHICLLYTSDAADEMD
jgi:arylsulfatase A